MCLRDLRGFARGEVSWTSRDCQDVITKYKSIIATGNFNAFALKDIDIGLPLSIFFLHHENSFSGGWRFAVINRCS